MRLSVHQLWFNLQNNVIAIVQALNWEKGQRKLWVVSPKDLNWISVCMKNMWTSSGTAKNNRQFPQFEEKRVSNVSIFARAHTYAQSHQNLSTFLVYESFLSVLAPLFFPSFCCPISRRSATKRHLPEFSFVLFHPIFFLRYQISGTQNLRFPHPDFSD